MKKVVVFGTSKLSELMYYYLTHDDRYELSAFSVDDGYYNSDSFMGMPVIRSSELTSAYPPEEYSIVMTMGYSSMNELRKDKFWHFKSRGYEIETYCHPSSVILTDKIGEGCIILENCTVGAFCELGCSNIIYPSTTIAHHTHIGDFNFFSVECAVAGDVNIKNNCFFGVNCTVRDSITVEDHTLVGAGAYISKSTESYGVYTPAKTVKLDKKSTGIVI